LGFSEKHWSNFAQLGWLRVPFTEDDGGFGGGATEMRLIMENIRRGLVVEPYLATVVLARGAIRHGGSDVQKRNTYPLSLADPHSERWRSPSLKHALILRT
jgi:alkylation response protein AidB-like acyl-CoA dehydrogenase